MTCSHVDGPRVFMLHCAHALGGTRADEVERNARVVLTSYAHRVESMYAVMGATLEIALAQFWSSAGETNNVTLKVDFHGIVPSPAAVTVDGAGGPRRVDIRAPLKAEKLAPAARLTAVRSAVRPSSAAVAPLSADRDMLPPLTGPGSGLVPTGGSGGAASGGAVAGRQIHKMVLTYKISVDVAGSYTLSLPGLNRRVYDGDMEAQMLFLFDSHGKMAHVHDIYPKAVKLKKGTYEAKVLMRHDNVERLEKAKVMPLVVERALDDAVVLKVSGDHNALVTQADAMKEARGGPGPGPPFRYSV